MYGLHCIRIWTKGYLMRHAGIRSVNNSAAMSQLEVNDGWVDTQVIGGKHAIKAVAESCSKQGCCLKAVDE